MILKRLYDDGLAQASYLIACAATGEAIVIDPNRDLGQYLDAARAEGVAITHVTETHIHADFLSGGRELSQVAGAQLFLSAEGGKDWQYAFAKDAGATLLDDGDVIKVGNIRIQAIHTPGHTPEHLTFLVTDTAAATEPIGAVTGDFIFVGDVGRPDLLEKAAKVQGTMEEAARTLFRSLQRFRSQPDFLQIWPGHGAGSACGKGMSSVPHSTMGYERRFSWAFGVEDEDAFVEQVLAGQPEPPKYFAEMKYRNRGGPAILGGFRRPELEPPGRLTQVLEGGGVVVDVRPAADFGLGHVPGTLNIPLNRAFSTWAGWLLPYDTDLYLLGDGTATAWIDTAVRELALIGLDQVAGRFDLHAIEQWAASRPLQTIDPVAVDEIEQRWQAGKIAVIDVRGRAEWDAGHMPGVPNIPLGYLVDHIEEIPRDRPVVLTCQSGSRSAIGAGLLQAHGVGDVSNLTGGFTAWARGGKPVAREADEPAGSVHD